MIRTFQSTLHRPAGTGTWTYFNVPFNVEEAFGNKGQVKVKGTVCGVPFRSSLMPHGDRTHYMVVKKEIRDAAGVTAGDPVQVSMERDADERKLDMPEDLYTALRQSAAIVQSFERLSYSCKKEYVEWIESAKKAETRTSRIEKAAAMIAEGRKLRG